ncbi:hypothetical protein [Nocardia macrotermitis]|uniref:Uncharacterized protein n=1 Tax=Nocardia macrotermitis TaxID=2585198 RepID=A0A7K0CZS1_9NOCA|nr:hypothetical protein [Nocardia macrotermitis]MQY18958.1 hypothetical protein [Nocardia macrotermitis]
MTRRRVPGPARHEPLIPAGLTLAVLAGTTIIAGVLGGGALSALLSWHRPALTSPTAAVGIVERLVRHPADPAAAWPHEPRPGPVWLTWPCILLAAIVWSAGMIILGGLIDERLGRRHRDQGLASSTDLYRTGLDARSAVRKAVHEYPNLTTEHPVRRRWR